MPPVKDKMLNNPIYFSNRETEILDESLKLILESLSQFASIKHLSDDKVDIIKNLIYRAYLEKRAEYFMKNSIAKFDEVFRNSICFALGKLPIY